MLDEILKLSYENIQRLLKKLKLETKKRIFNNIYTLTEELGLDKIPDYETRVKLRYDHIQKFPDTVFWDYAECQNRAGHTKFDTLIVSTTGIFVTLTRTNKLYITPLKTRDGNCYRTYRTKGKITNKHRVIASTFLPKPDRLKNIPFKALQINHIDAIKYNNRLSNLEWVTNQENQKHCHAYEKYKEEEYFLFRVIIDNGFKGREFVLPESSLGLLNARANSMRNRVSGVEKNIFRGMECAVMYREDLKEEYIGVPPDIKKLLDTNLKYFDTSCMPMIGRVLLGRYKGLEFSLFGCGETKKYFNRTHANAVARGERPSHLGCTFRYCTHREAIPLHNKMTKEIIDIVKQDKKHHRLTKAVVKTM